MKNYTTLNYRREMNLPDGIYNGFYNGEPVVIRMKDHIPVYVSFIGFLYAEREPRSSCIYDPKGVTLSNVEVLLPQQELNLTSTNY